MKRKNKRQFNWYSLNQRFSIRKYHFGAASVLLGTSLVFGNPTSVSADVVDVQPAPTGVDKAKLDNNNPAAPTVADLNKVFTSADVSKNGDAPEGTDTVTGKTVVDYKYETTEGVKIEEPVLDQVQGTNTVSTPYDNGVADTNNATDGKDYRESTVDAPLTFDKEAGKKDEILKDGKRYEYFETVESGTSSTEYAKTAFNDVSVSVTPENLHTATGEIKYDQITGGKVWIVEETADGTFGNFVVADAATSDAQVVEAFKKGTAKVLSQVEVTAAGGIKNGDHIIVLDKDLFNLGHQSAGEKFENREFVRESSTYQAIDMYLEERDQIKVGSPFTKKQLIDAVQGIGAVGQKFTPEGGFELLWSNDVAKLINDSIPEFNILTQDVIDKATVILDNYVGGDATIQALAYIESIKEKYANAIEIQPADTEIYDDFTISTGSYEVKGDNGSVQDSLYTPIRAYKVVESDKVVTYKYKDVTKGSVIVKYVETGTTNELVPEVKAVTDQLLKDRPSYDVAGHKQETVQDKDGKIWQLVGLEANSKPEKGDLVADQTLEVVYGYKLKTEETAEGALVNSKVGTVLVDFVDEAGQAIPGIDQVTLKNKVTVETSQKFVTKSGDVVISERTEVTPVKDVYDAKPLATPTITAKDGKVYEFVKLLSGTEAGDVQEGTHNVVYQYKLKTEKTEEITETKGNVIVKFVKEGTTEELSESVEAANAVVKTVVKTVVKSGDVEISKTETPTLSNATYDTEEKRWDSIEDADGNVYAYVGVQSGATAGVLPEGTTEVVYEYRLVEGALPDETIAYDIPEIEVTETEETIETKGNVIVKFVKEGTTEELSESLEVSNAVVKTVVNTIYKSGDVILATKEKSSTLSNVTYDTEEKRWDSIEDEDGNVYAYVSVQSGVPAGVLPEGTTEVVYAYRLVEGALPDETIAYDIPEIEVNSEEKDGDLKDSKVGKVTVDHILEDGTLITSEVDTPDTVVERTQTYVTKTKDGLVLNSRVEVTPVEVNYDTTDLKADYKEFNGKKYYFLKVADNSATETGQVVAGETKVVYVYRLVEGEVPNLPVPEVEKPELNIGVPNLPGELPPTTPEKPELNIGVPNLPGEFPPTVPEKPELELPTPESDIPNDFPTVDIPEGRINIPTPPVGEIPNKPELPATETPESPTNVTSGEPTAPIYSRVARNTEALPNTGDSENAFAAVTGIATILGAFGLVSKRRRKED